MMDEAESGAEISEQTAETVEQPVNSNEVATVASVAVMDDRMDEGGVGVPEDEARRLAETTLAV